MMYTSVYDESNIGCIRSPRANPTTMRWIRPYQNKCQEICDYKQRAARRSLLIYQA